jgi:hypothetical protein
LVEAAAAEEEVKNGGGGGGGGRRGLAAVRGEQEEVSSDLSRTSLSLPFLSLVS